MELFSSIYDYLISSPWSKLFGITLAAYLTVLFLYRMRKGLAVEFRNFLGISPMRFPERDQLDREVSRRFDYNSKQLYEELSAEVRGRIDEALTSNALVEQVLDQKLKEELLVELDDAVNSKLQLSAAKVQAIRHINEMVERVRIKFDSPASAAEKAAKRSTSLAYFMAFSGVVVAFGRVIHIAAQQSFPIVPVQTSAPLPAHVWSWPEVVSQSGPWIGLVLLIEFTALLFFRFYARSIELQRHFTEKLATLETQFTSLKVVVDLGSAEDIVKAAVVTMNIADVPFTKPDDSEDISTLAKMVESLADVVKKLKPGSE